MKNTILLSLIICLLSCGKSTYYVYEGKDIDHRSYCTLEITKKKEIIYRAASYKYWADSYPYSNLYIYIYNDSDKYTTDIEINRYRFAFNTSELFYVENTFNPPVFNFTIIGFDYGVDYAVSYYTNKNNDTIFCTAERDFEYLKKGFGFKEHGIKWFPPYMVKADSIDYTKFGKEIQHLNLKNPKKEK